MGAEYVVWLRDQYGNRQALFDHYMSLAYTKRVNQAGTYSLQLSGLDPRIDLFELDCVVEVLRRDVARGVPWTQDFCGLHRKATRQYNQRQSYFTSEGVGLLDLLARRIIYAAPGTPEADKAGPGETVAKAFVEEQAGPTAGVRAISGLTVQADAAAGELIALSRPYKNLLDVLAEIAPMGQIDYDLVSTGAGAFEFRTYHPRLGQDRSSTSLNPTIFSLQLGNMGEPAYRLDNTQEVNAVYMGGQGAGTTRLIEEVQDPNAVVASPLARREAWRDSSNDTSSAALIARGLAVLWELAATEDITFEVLQTPGCVYNKHYWLGDLITARYQSIVLDRKITAVQVSVKASSDGPIDKISLELSNDIV